MGRRIFYLCAFFLLAGTQKLLGQNHNSLGIGVIINSTIKTSESFAFYKILKSLDIKNSNGASVRVVFSENPLNAYYFISGTIEHYKIQQEYFDQYSFKNVPYKYDVDKYVTKYNLQIWIGGKHNSSFIDSTLYIPTKKDNKKIKFLKTLSSDDDKSICRLDEFYSNEFLDHTTLMTAFLNKLQSALSFTIIYKNADFEIINPYKYDAVEKAKVELVGFLPRSYNSSPIDTAFANKAIYNDLVKYFYENYYTIGKGELTYVISYCNEDLQKLIASLAFPKSTRIRAGEVYLQLADKYKSANDIEGFGVASWAALIISNTLKSDIISVLNIKQRSLSNLSTYCVSKGQTNYAKMISLTSALIDAFIKSDDVNKMVSSYNKTNNDLARTFVNIQTSINKIIKENKRQGLLSLIDLAGAIGSSVADSKEGLTTPSARTNQLSSALVTNIDSRDKLIADTKNSLINSLTNIDFRIPQIIFQPEVNNNIDPNTASLYLECMRLIIADKENKFWPDILRSTGMFSKVLFEIEIKRIVEASESTTLKAKYGFLTELLYFLEVDFYLQDKLNIK